jgi:regulator of cell morphogenesis and NO signaling
MSAVLESTALTFDAETPLGEIAVRLPGATAVFRRLKLDFCCGGNIPLAQAAQARGLDASAVLAQLAELDRGDAAVTQTEPAALIDHILARYHEVHRQQLPELERMARRVEAVHADHPGVPAGLAAVLDAMHQEMLSHMAKEEQVLFPMMRSGGHPMAHHPIAMMRQEHTDHGATLDEIDRLTRELTPPPGACNTWRALYTGLAALKDDLIQHIHLENNVLFPQFERESTGGSCCGGGTCGSAVASGH